MDSNHRSAVCKTAAFAAWPQDRVVRDAAAGIEPASKCFRGTRPYQHRPHRRVVVRRVVVNRAKQTEVRLTKVPRRIRTRVFGVAARRLSSRPGARCDLLRAVRCEKSASRESNPPVRFGRPAPLPLGQRHVVSLCCVVSFRAVARIGAGGIRTLTVRFKRPMCSRYTTTPWRARTASVFDDRGIASSVFRCVNIGVMSCPRRNRTFVSVVSERRPSIGRPGIGVEHLGTIARLGFEPKARRSKRRMLPLHQQAEVAC